MVRCFLFFLVSFILGHSHVMNGQENNSVELHIQVYDRGICMPMLPSNYYQTSRYHQSKSVLSSGAYYSTINALINSPDSADLNPQVNHELQSSSLQFNPNLDYELVILRGDGFNRNNPDSMVIHIANLEHDAQIIIPFKKGNFKLQKMTYFNKLKPDVPPNFRKVNTKDIKNMLKLDSISFYKNNNVKTKYFKVTNNFPLYYVQEFDSIHPNNFSQGFHLLSNYPKEEIAIKQVIWSDASFTKYGYWEYFENGKLVKHEMWVSMLQERYEWYPSGNLKYAVSYGHANKEIKHAYYLENGAIKEEFITNSNIRQSALKSYAYSAEGNLILINTYSSTNGITKQGLQKRELFFPSGNLKMVESFQGTYSIQYYNQDGTEKNN